MASFKSKTFGERNNLVVRLAKGIQMVETNMNRRRFITQLGSAVAAFTILPSATTYARRWVKLGSLHVPTGWTWDVTTRHCTFNPDWTSCKHMIQFLYEDESGGFVELMTTSDAIPRLNLDARKWKPVAAIPFTSSI